MTESSIAIRRAGPDDATAIAEVHVASWRTTYPGIVDQAYIDSLSVSDRAAAWTRRLTSPDSHSAPDIFVGVDQNDRVVGFISGGLIREPFPTFDAELHAIYLLKEFQRGGIGRRLVRDWATAAVDRGLHAGIVRVLADNPTCNFYERLGAELVRTAQLAIGGKDYPERWYAWRNLADLTE